MEYKVTVSLTVYNHRPYIKKTLDSIVNQKTNFHYKVVVHDDASTDGTQEIIEAYAEKYPDMIFPILQKENQYSKGVLIAGFTFPQFEGRYVAFCEGDDNWACEDKLQIQYDFLENHPDYSAVCGCTDYIGERDEHLSFPMLPPKKYRGNEIPAEKFQRGINFGTNTMMVRAEMLNPDFLEKKKGSRFVGDNILIYQAYSYGKIYAIDKVFEHHRVQTRPNASNYNSIFTIAQKFQYGIDALNTIVRNFPNHGGLEYKGRRTVGFYFWRMLFVGQLKDFFKVYDSVDSKIKPNLFFAALTSFPVFIKKGVNKAITLYKVKK